MPPFGPTDSSPAALRERRLRLLSSARQLSARARVQFSFNAHQLPASHGRASVSDAGTCKK